MKRDLQLVSPAVARQRAAAEARRAQAARLWSSEYVSTEINEANQQAWLRSVELLGDRWLLAKQVQRGAA